MAARAQRVDERWLARRIEHGDPFWPPQLAVAIAIALNLAMAEKLTPGPRWLPAAIEGALLVVLVATTRNDRATEHAPGRRRLALAVVGLVSAANVFALALLVHYLVGGGEIQGRSLIGSGALLLVNNMLLFAVWYWELDGGGPVERFRHPPARPDFQFTQMDNPELTLPGWRPGFGDYLYLSFTNTTAFSPTDTMPLTHAAKAIMALQSATALTTIGLVVARAVNILG
jgi:hypothetical protein